MSNIPGVTQVRPNIKIVGKIDIEEIFVNNKYKSEEDSDDERYSKKEVNKHLEKYAKSSGGKGPMPSEL